MLGIRAPRWSLNVAFVIFAVIVDLMAARKFLMSVPISEWGDGEWLMCGLIAATLLISAGILWLAIDAQFFAPKRNTRRRAAELNDPLDLHFLVPERSQRAIDYASQDNDEHLLNEIILPPHAKSLVEFRLHPRAKFVTTHLIFGCRDDGSFTARVNKPHPVRMIDVYGQAIIELHKGRFLPDGHVINSRYQYRWNHEIKWDGHSTIIIGVEIQTNEIGRYLWEVTAVGEEINKVYEMNIRVENQVIPENRKTQMLRCANGDHSGHLIEPSFSQSPYSSARLTFSRPIAAITASKNVAGKVPRLSFAATVADIMPAAVGDRNLNSAEYRRVEIVVYEALKKLAVL
jgi:hypothetical protein